MVLLKKSKRKKVKNSTKKLENFFNYIYTIKVQKKNKI